MPSIRIFRPWTICLILCAVYGLALIVIRGGGSPLILMTLGERFAPPDLQHALYSEEGYDGQFVYYIARDPSSAFQWIDVPAYRFQRILLPIGGRILSAAQEGLLPWALFGLNLAALAVGTALLENLLVQMNRSRWIALGYGLSVGVFGAARLITTETLAYALVLGGIWLARREKWLFSAAIFALAALAKETTMLFPAAYFLLLIYRRRWQTGVLFGVLALLPFLIWQGVLYGTFGEFGIGSGGALATSFEIIPLMGFLRILTEGGLAVFLIFLLIVGPFVLLPTLWGLWQCWRDLRARRWTLDTLLLFVNCAVMLFVPFSTYRELLGILRFIVGLQIALILYAAHRRQTRALRFSTFWAITSLLVIASDFGAAQG